MVISMTKDDFKISFDCFFPTKNGHLTGTVIKPGTTASIERTQVSPLKKGSLVDINVLHGMLGHPSEASTRKKRGPTMD
jgi:hypothetical protein